uniref:Restriction of telomere capping protein 5 n=1 Tax=Anoplophora glabripennis TaxID=217634 RepID=V5GHT7_ANOGL
MGNHHGHGHKSGNSTPSSGASSQDGSRKSISRTTSGNDIEEKQPTQFQILPTEKLAKILTEKAQKEEGVSGITPKVFTHYLFPRYPVLGEKLFDYFHTHSKSKNSYIGTTAFKLQCENYLAILDDDVIRDTLVRMWASQGEDPSGEVMTPEGMTSLLMCTYHISMDHYSEGPQMCLSSNKTLKAVVDSCFYSKKSLSVQFVSHWIQSNIPRILFPLHRYAVHSLATSWRTLEECEQSLAAGKSRDIVAYPGLELATPVLEQQNPFPQAKPHPHMLTMSMSWLLAGALPPLYSRPQKAQSPSNSGVGLASKSFLSKLVCAIPSHWTILYDSDEMGLGSNRFLHHVLSYKGPTLVLLRVQDGQKFCIAAPNEWRESHHYWGGEECAVFQLLPKFHLLERGAKMLYLNLSVRGYPQGLRVGKDPRAPILTIDGGFEKMEFQKIPYYLECIEVWGCGDHVSLERQLEVKKWEVKEAERQRTVKMSAADWLDHPDRYLLELAGRPQYHQSQT